MLNRLRIAAGALGAAALLGACADFGAPDPASDQADSVFSLWRGTVVAALVVGGVVWGLIGWALIRYRRRSDDVPDQKAHNIPLEVVYTAVPVLIVAVLFVFTMRTQSEVSDLTEDPDVTVEVVGFQWQWQFRYEDGAGGEGPVVTGASVGAPPELVLPVDQTTRLKLVDEGRHPLVLRARLPVEARPDPGRRQRARRHAERDRPLRRALRRVLRPRPLAHELLGAGRERLRVHTVAGRPGTGRVVTTLDAPRPRRRSPSTRTRCRPPASSAGSPPPTTRRSASATW